MEGKITIVIWPSKIPVSFRQAAIGSRSLSRCAKSLRARWSRLMTVPIGTPSVFAASS
jgi:hypothetical protein